MVKCMFTVTTLNPRTSKQSIRTRVNFVSNQLELWLGYFHSYFLSHHCWEVFLTNFIVNKQYLSFLSTLFLVLPRISLRDCICVSYTIFFLVVTETRCQTYYSCTLKRPFDDQIICCTLVQYIHIKDLYNRICLSLYMCTQCTQQIVNVQSQRVKNLLCLQVNSVLTEQLKCMHKRGRT